MGISRPLERYTLSGIFVFRPERVLKQQAICLVTVEA
jgi:hypothetical protein